MVLPASVPTPTSDPAPRIGLEVHVQLSAPTKLFCACAPDGRHNCPVCQGHPGTLPVLAIEAVALGVRAALALGATVHTTSGWARKHYDWPDLPKGYQLTQGEVPLASDGIVAFSLVHHGAGVSHPRNAPGAVIGRIVLHDRMPGAREMAVTLGLGLHLRGSDDPARADVRTARARHPFLLGASTHSPEEARAALRAGADYVLLSPIWPSPSKPDDARTPLGAEVFDALRGLPVLALGGLTPERLSLARSNGAWGGAAMGALFDAKEGALTREHVDDGVLETWLRAANYSP